jgi:hypothetical protein
MSEEQKDFMHLDLFKLTLVGWFMMLSTIVIVLGVTIGLGFLLQVLGAETAEGRMPRWVMGICLVAGIAIGGGYFEGGRRLLRHIGLPLTRE